MSYRSFAQVYDVLMDTAPYDKWTQLVLDSIEKYNVPGKEILDLGCGTGTITYQLALKGYELTGVDLSADMLAIARQKTEALPVHYFQQNMAKLELNRAFDLVLILCDALNYLDSKEKVLKTFNKVYEHLNNNGMLLFDVHSPYKMTHLFGNETFTYQSEDVSYIWECIQDDLRVQHDLTLFIKREDALHERHYETHIQTTFSIEEYDAMLAKAGFTVLDVFADFTLEAPNEKSERIFFLAKK